MRRLISFLLPLLLAPMLAFGESVNINTADAATFARELKGVGPAKAAAIVAYRAQYGAFKTVDDLALVKGIGPRFIEQNRAQLRLDKRPAAPAPAALAPKPKR